MKILAIQFRYLGDAALMTSALSDGRIFFTGDCSAGSLMLKLYKEGVPFMIRTLFKQEPGEV